MVQEKSIPNILILDDEMTFYEKFRWNMEDQFKVWPAPNYEQALVHLRNQSIDLILLDLALEGDGNLEPGLSLIQPLKQNWEIPIIIVTSDTKNETIIAAMKFGADYYLQKGEYDPDSWITIIIKQLNSTQLSKGILPPTPKVKEENINEQVLSPPKRRPEKEQFITQSPPLVAIKEKLRHISRDYPSASILLLGETGVGKEIAAKFIHQNSSRRNAPFLAINMTSLNETMWERELFGHEKGAFTGAINSVPGYFENADGGVLFLDEIGEIDLEMQKKLLRVLQDHKIRRLGGRTDKALDIQIVLATNRDLRQAVKEGKMREDFFHRISQYPITIPPLRKRPEDVEPLITFFMSDTSICPVPDPFFGKTAAQAMEEECLTFLKLFSWPGNVRQLQNCCRQMIINTNLKGEQVIDISSLPEEVRFPEERSVKEEIIPSNTRKQDMVSLEYDEAKRRLYAFEKALLECAGRKDDAAKKLGLKNDQTLRYRIKKKWFTKFPELFNEFPTIKKAYKLNENDQSTDY